MSEQEQPAIETRVKKLDPQSMSRKEAEEIAEQLRERLAYHNYLYYVKNTPEVSDQLYDTMFRLLQTIEEQFPELETADSPTRRVGAPPVDELKEVQHVAPLLSLNSKQDEEGIIQFEKFLHRELDSEHIRYVSEPKLDGLSVEIVFENGIFSYGDTRGDGQTGEDISENLKTIGPLPLRLQKKASLPDFLAVRGEVFMLKDGFQELNRKRIQDEKDPFANPRNAAAGTLRQLDSKNVADKPLDIFFYEILSSSETISNSHWEVLDAFRTWGLKTNPLNRLCENHEELKEYYHKIIEKRDSLNYELDGVVIKLDNYSLRERLGTRHRSPRWAIAWKFPPHREVTILHDIMVQVGRSGMLTPVALLDPVEIGGVTVSRATLHNEDEVKRKDVRPGDTVRVIRAGDVIPEVLERVDERPEKKRAKPFSMPGQCPICGTKVVREGAYYLCPAGMSCPAQLRGRLQHYASRDAANIETLGEKITNQLVETGLVEELSDLYRLTKKDLLELEGFADRSAQVLIDEIQASKKTPLDRFIYALGVKHIGLRMAGILARKYGTMKKLMKADSEELQQIPEVGPKISKSVTNFFSDARNKKIIEDLFGLGVDPQPVETPEEQADVEAGEQPLEGRTFVFTGNLKDYTRKAAERTVESLGGRATSSVSSNTDYVVSGENPGSKLEKAEELGIEVLTENEFKKLLKNFGGTVAAGTYH
jgi:DNA ligase (NAD+)